MVTKELIEYTKTELSKGVPLEVLTSALKQNKWSDQDILELFKTIQPQEISLSTTEPIQTKNFVRSPQIRKMIVLQCIFLAVVVGVAFLKINSIRNGLRSSSNVHVIERAYAFSYVPSICMVGVYNPETKQCEGGPQTKEEMDKYIQDMKNKDRTQQIYGITFLLFSLLSVTYGMYLFFKAIAWQAKREITRVELCVSILFGMVLPIVLVYFNYLLQLSGLYF